MQVDSLTSYICACIIFNMNNEYSKSHWRCCSTKHSPVTLTNHQPGSVRKGISHRPHIQFEYYSLNDLNRIGVMLNQEQSLHTDQRRSERKGKRRWVFVSRLLSLCPDTPTSYNCRHRHHHHEANSDNCDMSQLLLLGKFEYTGGPFSKWF